MRHPVRWASLALLAPLPACGSGWVDDPSGPLQRLSVSPAGLHCVRGERRYVRVDVDVIPGPGSDDVAVSITPDNANVAVAPGGWRGNVTTDSTAVTCQSVGTATISVAATDGLRTLSTKVPVTITAAP